MRKIYLPLFVALLALTGCEKDAASIEAREERDPLVISGQELMEQGKYEEAIDAFKQAILNEPLMARPHLDLAIIYQQHHVNYIHSIYHYDRFLELRPNDEKAEFINEQKLKVAQALANTLINNSPEVKDMISKYNEQVQRNKELMRQLDAALKAQKTTATPAPGTKKTATQTVPKTAKPTTTATKKPATKTAPAPAANGKHQIYYVVSGDTLTKIATKFYGDSGKWDIIFNANKDTLRTPSSLKVGQTLVIPAIGN